MDTNVKTASPAELIGEALRYLAGICDGAHDKDNCGFNRLDTDFGKDLAAKSLQRPLTVPQQKAALRMLRKYVRQLHGAGLALPTEEAIEAAAIRANGGQPVKRPAGKIGVQGSLCIVTFPYDPQKVERIKAIAGRRWDSAGKFWSVPLDKAEAVIAAFPGFELDPALQAAREAARAEAELAIQAADSAQRTLLEVVGDLSAPLPGGKVLFRHQREAVERMLRQGKVILADDMGLGKTLEALVAAKAYGLPVFVVCPASLKTNWLREAEQAGVQIEVYSWAKLPEAPETDFVLICDEAHYAQNLAYKRQRGEDGQMHWVPAVKRTARMLELAKSEYCRACYLLTGTPIKNGRPCNLYPLLLAVGHPLAKNRKEYDIRYCNAGPTRWSNWDRTGAAHLDELHEKTRDIIIRRTKAQCLDLPPKLRVVRRAELSSEAQAEYDGTLHNLQQEYQRRVRAGEITDQAEALVLVNHLRHAGSLAKTGTAVDLSQETLEQGGQVVLFVAFKDAGERIARELGCEFLSGDTPVADRQGIIDRFQAGTRRALVCSFGAGGVGITLTAAQTVILVDRPWTPGDAEQAEDRLHRIGQQGNVTAVWLQANGTDEAIDTILQAKAERIELVLQGKRRTMRGIGSPAEIAAELLPVLLG